MAERELLVVIDVQAGFVNDWTRHLPPAVEALQGEFARVVATRFVNPPGSAHRRLIGWSRFAPGSPEVELAFRPRADALVFDKPTYTCLGPVLRDFLALHRIGTVHLCGIATDNCVLKTAVDLFEGGWRPVVLADFCASHGGPQAHDCGLLLLRRFIGRDQVVSGGGSSTLSS